MKDPVLPTGEALVARAEHRERWPPPDGAGDVPRNVERQESVDVVFFAVGIPEEGRVARPLPEYLGGKDSKIQVRMVLHGVGALLQAKRSEAIVGIEKDDIFAPGNFQALVATGVRSNTIPSAPQKTNPGFLSGQRLHLLDRGVVGTIIHDNGFPVRIRL